ncbi:RDD family protein [Streptomyces sp. NBC_01343]|uniref:RDD family protein n=1 Tax=Streptomyces sp. NBC_01343 TaxID=2903832 RepID=UPI002E0E7DCE|nr:RDD family protein [Streptomyces sp. NBC_01343]
MTASPGDGEHAAREGYYPDPSIPGFVRYWNGLNWVPGTSRPAAAAPAAAAAARSDETGPVFLDETGLTEALREPEPVAPAAPAASADPAAPAASAAPAAHAASWQADPQHQSGFGGPRDDRVSWGSPEQPEQPEPEGGHGPARSAPAGLSQGRGPRPEPLEAAERAERGPGVSFARTPSATAERFPEQAAVRGPAESVGILSARSPAAAPAPAAAEPAWPSAGDSAAPSGLTSSWPETPLHRAPAIPSAWDPSARAEPEAPAGRAPSAPPEPEIPEGWDPAGRSGPGAPAARHPAGRPAPEAPSGRYPSDRFPAARPGSAAPSDRFGADRFGADQSAPASASRRPGPGAAHPDDDPASAPPAGRTAPRVTDRAVFERMAERATRPAGLVRRAVARALDTLVLGAVAAATAWPLVPAATAHLEAKVDAAKGSGRTTTVWLFDATIAGYAGLVLGALLLFGVFYEALPTARWGRTPGKKLLGIRVLAAATLRPPTFGAALRRWLVYAFLGLPGSLWCLGDRPRRRGWHDRAAGTYVAR